MPPAAKLSLVLPMYNEAANAAAVVNELIAALEKEKICFELILVDNGSRDGTGLILAKLAQGNPAVKVVRVPRNLGYGWGIINGLRWAAGEYLGFMGGDGQVDPADVPRVFKHLLAGNFQLCKVKRQKRQDGLLRKLVSHIFNKLFVYTFKVNVGDINGSPKIMTRWCYENLNLCSKDWFLDAEVVLKASYLNLSVGEIPIVFRRRQGGRSSVRPRTVWEFLRNMTIYRIRGVLREGGDFVWRQRNPA
ncbi:glycosyltransferase family 2 protein [Desulforamulus hydrothermalis]|uniref:Glycosyl transferase, family 2 n=1 Tax=Desulforamulus hydrothermalis Lam5 = DSM 18033 TaxID=1121428 RepID=K8E151_9FIRM|nr:glycosyltransferase family 2 protein [Desulforamulus hydrothermalis]CCO09360.1 Glycosyl transferase, family 2 [Desulforamulus hydrothermalis Lam5 = DSM 18033]SHH32216.1 Glycosyl transferase family 2 [Desulforamulus hydrothermalis Lam5 = DSM 18033]